MFYDKIYGDSVIGYELFMGIYKERFYIVFGNKIFFIIRINILYFKYFC